MRKKIIISNYDDIKNPYYAGGGARAIHEVAKRLVDEFQVTVITGKYPNGKNEIIDGVFYKRIGLKFGSPKLCQLIYQLILPFFAKREEYDVWIVNFTPPFTTSFLPSFTNKPVLGMVHMLAAEDMQRKYKLPFYFIENAGLRKYRNIIVTQKNIKTKIERINSKAFIKIIPNGVDFYEHKRVKKKHILFLGRIEINQKGLDLLINSYKKIKRLTQVPLVIAGTGEQREISQLKKLIKKEKLTNEIKLVGRVEGRVKNRLLNEAYCLIVPSRFETFSMVSLEALSSYTPLIAFDIDGLQWIPDNLCVKISPFDTEKLSAAMQESINISPAYNLKNIKNFVSLFSWENIALRYRDILSEING